MHWPSEWLHGYEIYPLIVDQLLISVQRKARGMPVTEVKERMRYALERSGLNLSAFALSAPSLHKFCQNSDSKCKILLKAIVFAFLLLMSVMCSFIEVAAVRLCSVWMMNLAFRVFLDLPYGYVGPQRPALVYIFDLQEITR
ncbi:hypothetical protein GYMLUDRAFT_960667, partial [Collybiopsis luxurians FD-317 M1]